MGPNPIRVVLFLLSVTWGLSSAGRASALQAEGHRFEPCRPHIFSLVDRETPADVAQLAEQLICNQQVIGSSPIIGLNICQCGSIADVAQLAEQLICNQQVIGSSPIIGLAERPK